MDHCLVTTSIKSFSGRCSLGCSKESFQKKTPLSHNDLWREPSRIHHVSNLCKLPENEATRETAIALILCRCNKNNSIASGLGYDDVSHATIVQRAPQAKVHRATKRNLSRLIFRFGVLSCSGPIIITFHS